MTDAPDTREIAAPDTDRFKEYLSGISVADHMGDVNDYLPNLCSALGLPQPWWSDEWCRFIMEWDLAARPESYSGQHVSRGRYGSPEYEERTL